MKNPVDHRRYLMLKDELVIYKRGMALEGKEPVCVWPIPRTTARRLKESSITLYGEGGDLSEWAFDKLLAAQHVKHVWGDQPDFTLADGTTIGVRSGRHRDLMKFEARRQCSIAYPVRRLHPDYELPDYVLGTTVFGLSCECTVVAMWGIISRDHLVEVVSKLWREHHGDEPYPKGGNACENIPLAEFKPEPLIRIAHLTWGPKSSHDL
jgi:hypothetical protein